MVMFHGGLGDVMSDGGVSLLKKDLFEMGMKSFLMKFHSDARCRKICFKVAIWWLLKITSEIIEYKSYFQISVTKEINEMMNYRFSL